jgi:hypothetical protein
MSRAAGELGPASRLSGSSQLQLPLGTQIASSALTPSGPGRSGAPSMSCARANARRASARGVHMRQLAGRRGNSPQGGAASLGCCRACGGTAFFPFSRSPRTAMIGHDNSPLPRTVARRQASPVACRRMTDMGILLADFLTRAAVAPSAPAAAAASSARVPRRQNAGSEGQRSRLR